MGTGEPLERAYASLWGRGILALAPLLPSPSRLLCSTTLSYSEKKAEAADIPVIVKMSEAAAKMVRDSVNAYVEKDLELSRAVIEYDDVVDEMFEENKKQLIDYISKNGGEGGKEAIDLIMVAKYLERIADHATNIAEWVEFSITGIHKESKV